MQCCGAVGQHTAPKCYVEWVEHNCVARLGADASVRVEAALLQRAAAAREVLRRVDEACEAAQLARYGPHHGQMSSWGWWKCCGSHDPASLFCCAFENRHRVEREYVLLARAASDRG